MVLCFAKIRWSCFYMYVRMIFKALKFALMRNFYFQKYEDLDVLFVKTSLFIVTVF